METIDFIELLKRVNEGKAPKKIEINETEYVLTGVEEFNIYFLYKKADSNSPVYWFFNDFNINFDTKIKILDKPIIKKIDETYMNLPEVYDKLNEVIDYINENKEREK